MNKYTFVNKEGKEIIFNSSHSFEDLIKMGFSDIKFVVPGTPLAENEFRCDTKNEK